MCMNYEQFIRLTEMITPIVSKTDTVMRKRICSKQILSLTFRFLATGESFCLLEYQFRISRKAFFYIIDEVCRAIVTMLAGTYIKFPSYQEDLKNIEKNFPHCIGAVDGKHIEIIGCGMGSQYYNYKGTNSIVFSVVAVSNYKVTWANVAMNERISDGGVLKRIKIGQSLEEGLLNLPALEPLPGRSISTPYVFIGDDAFALAIQLQLQPIQLQPLQHWKQPISCGKEN